MLADDDLTDNSTCWEVKADKAPASALTVSVSFTKKGNVVANLPKGTLNGAYVYASAGDSVKSVVITPSSDSTFNYVWNGSGTITPGL